MNPRFEYWMPHLKSTIKRRRFRAWGGHQVVRLRRLLLEAELLQVVRQAGGE
jgi:hypothetical protein